MTLKRCQERTSVSQADQAPCLSIIVPAFNEFRTLSRLISAVRQSLSSHSFEIIVIDDGSTDGTTELIEGLVEARHVRAIYHPRNRGKGAAVRAGFDAAHGEVIIIQDADLEYDPADIERLVNPILSGDVDVVYGSRFVSDGTSRCSPMHRAANRLLTWMSNRFTGLALTDMETCYKAMRREVATSIDIRENGFGLEPELTAKIARGGWRFAELPIGYNARSRAAGKKIGFGDGLRSIWCILRFSRWD